MGHDGERFLAVPYPAAGKVELVDLLRRARAGAVDVGGRVGAVAFPVAGGRLWAVDEESGQLLAIDPRSRGIVTRTDVGPGRSALAFGARGGRALVTTGARATLVDVRAGRSLDARALPAAAVAVAAAPALGSYVVAHADGRVSLLPAAADRLGAPRTVRVGAPAAGTAAVGLAPDGRTAVVLNERAGEMVLLDASEGRVLRRVEAEAPRDLRFASHFALARSAGGSEVTWVDLDTPSRSNVLTTAPGRGLAPGLEEDEALVPSPAARKAYRVHVMHGRPMVMDEISNTIAADVAVVASGSLQATDDGVLEQRTLLEQPGRYRLELRLAGGEPFRFPLRVAAPAATTRARPRRERLEASVDAPLTVRFDVAGAAPEEAHVLAYGGRVGTLRQLQAPARRVGARGYEATLRFPAPGRFRVELLSEEAGLQPGPGTGLIVRVRP